jgi:hypothetical protein
MKRALFLLTALAVTGAALLPSTGRGQPQGPAPAGFPFDGPGPGDGGATLKQPWQDGPARPAAPTPAVGLPPAPTVGGTQPAAPGELQGLWNAQATGQPAGVPARLAQAVAAPDINKDIEVTPALGPWLICVISYTGEKAPLMARNAALELRASYKLPAFVFNYGAEERRKELARVKAKVDQQREWLEKNGLSVAPGSIHVKTVRIQEHCGVLIGGYRDEATAQGILKGSIRKLKMPDEKKVEMETKFVAEVDPNHPTKFKGGEHVYVNPFERAFVVRNPTVKVERPAEWDKLDIEALRRMNSEEEYSLLQNKKRLTLAIKQYQTPTTVEQRGAARPNGLLTAMGLRKSEQVDAAAENAHNLAEVLRKAQLETYVLHTKFASIVTVGGFDSLEDPNLRATQHLLETRLKMDALQLFPRPLPMEVPR